LAFSKYRGRSDGTAITKWNQGDALTQKLIEIQVIVGNAQLEMLNDPVYATIFIAKLQELWGHIRPIMIQKNFMIDKLESIDKRFPQAQLLVRAYGSKRYSSYDASMAIWNKLNSFFNEIETVTQLMGFAIPMTKTPMSEEDKANAYVSNKNLDVVWTKP
jgi:hypothetical protein